MAEETLRRNLHAVFDPAPDFPHPMLLSRTMSMLEVEVDRPRSREFARPVWLLPVVAALLALAIVITLLLASNALNPFRSVPTHPHGTTITRSIWPQMMSATSGWSSAHGPLRRTTDGGAYWTSVTVPAVLLPPPTGPNSFFEGDYFLGADQAWIARGLWVERPEFVVLQTADGGLSWHQSAVVTINSPAGTPSGIGVALYFLNSARGWLFVSTSGFSESTATVTSVDTLYSTTDGGMHWALLSTNTWFNKDNTFTGCAWGGPVFASASTGFMGYVPALCPAAASTYPSLLATNDGGMSWHFEALPLTPTAGCQPGHSSCPVPRPTFVDELHGFLDAALEGGFLTTSDGGLSWTVRPPPPGASGGGWLTPTAGWSWTQPQAARATPGSSPAPQPVTLYSTHDGGVSWRQVQNDLSGQISQLYFVDEATGFAVVDATGGSQLIKTTDGGAHWTVVGPLS